LDRPRRSAQLKALVSTVPEERGDGGEEHERDRRQSEHDALRRRTAGSQRRSEVGELVAVKRRRNGSAAEISANLRVPETRFGVSERVWAGSSGDDLMLLLAV
jgi:hypothetical protein